MHAMFNGAISFGLVSIPVKMFAATEEKDIRFRQIHKKCHTPVKYQKVCPMCNEEVKPDDIVKGFEYEPGKFVIVSSEDIESARAEVQARTIEIVDFVSLAEIDPIYYDKSYYLAPQAEVAASAKAYNLLREAMARSGRIAVARVTMRDKQTLCVLRIYGDALVLETIFYPDEIRPVEQVPALPQGMKTDEKEMDIAEKLIGNLTASFDPAKYTDTYREALRRIIDDRIAGRQVVSSPDLPESNVIDLMEALKASVERTEQKNKAQKAPRKKQAT
jgi:DNA end-binding protein Ku